MKKETTKAMGVAGKEAKCIGIHELIDWQVIQYRKEVDAYRHDLSKAQGRCVSWQEAEKEFSQRNFGDLADQWRVEYCGLHCSERKNCLLAAQFLNQKKTAPLYRFG